MVSGEEAPRRPQWRKLEIIYGTKLDASFFRLLQKHHLRSLEKFRAEYVSHLLNDTEFRETIFGRAIVGQTGTKVIWPDAAEQAGAYRCMAPMLEWINRDNAVPIVVAQEPRSGIYGRAFFTGERCSVSRRGRSGWR